VSHFEQGRLCVFGHFNQPPRGNPLTREIGTESEAAPYENWNTRIADHCYRPNAVAGNFSAMSFSMGEPLMRWLEMHEPEIYEAIIASDRTNEDGHGSALATTKHHSILPLARKRDKLTQIRWGIAAFEHPFGRNPLGFRLPEMAVHHET
jgi:alpha-amylase/alpha-mannosidase (GH57 family)